MDTTDQRREIYQIHANDMPTPEWRLSFVPSAKLLQDKHAVHIKRCAESKMFSGAYRAEQEDMDDNRMPEMSDGHHTCMARFVDGEYYLGMGSARRLLANIRSSFSLPDIMGTMDNEKSRVMQSEGISPHMMYIANHTSRVGNHQLGALRQILPLGFSNGNSHELTGAVSDCTTN